MNKLEHLLPQIKNNISKFRKSGVLSVRPGYLTDKKKDWLTKKPAIVAVTAKGKKPPKLPRRIAGTPVDVREATDLEQFSHDHPEKYSQLADHRAELRGNSLIPEFSPATGGVKPPIAAKVAAAHQTQIPV